MQRDRKFTLENQDRGEWGSGGCNASDYSAQVLRTPTQVHFDRACLTRHSAERPLGFPHSGTAGAATSKSSRSSCKAIVTNR